MGNINLGTHHVMIKLHAICHSGISRATTVYTNATWITYENSSK